MTATTPSIDVWGTRVQDDRIFNDLLTALNSGKLGAIIFVPLEAPKQPPTTNVVELFKKRQPDNPPKKRPGANSVVKKKYILNNDRDMPDAIPERSLLKQQMELLSRNGVPQPYCLVLSEGFCRVIDHSRDDPEAAVAAMDIADRHLTKARTAESQLQNWQERVAPEGLPPKQKGGRKRQDPPPTEADLKRANGILWDLRDGKKVDAEDLKKARRDLKWAQNEKRRRLAWKEASRTS